MYYFAKFAFLWYVILPSTRGATVIYENFIEPRVKRNVGLMEDFILNEVLNPNFILHQLPDDRLDEVVSKAERVIALAQEEKQRRAGSRNRGYLEDVLSSPGGLLRLPENHDKIQIERVIRAESDTSNSPPPPPPTRYRSRSSSGAAGAPEAESTSILNTSGQQMIDFLSRRVHSAAESVRSRLSAQQEQRQQQSLKRNDDEDNLEQEELRSSPS